MSSAAVTDATAPVTGEPSNEAATALVGADGAAQMDVEGEDGPGGESSTAAEPEATAGALLIKAGAHQAVVAAGLAARLNEYQRCSASSTARGAATSAATGRT